MPTFAVRLVVLKSKKKGLVMKKLLFVIMLLGLTMASAVAAPVSKDKAMSLAKSVLVANNIKSEPSGVRKAKAAQSIQVREISLRPELSKLYMFATEDAAILMAADDRVRPVLAYLDHAVPQDVQMPDNLKNWLRGYQREIEWAIENNCYSAEAAQEWAALTNASMAAADVVVAPLMGTTWDQGSPYNLLIPNKYPTGCVATAMAQVMRYWEFPKKGLGSHSYEQGNKTLSADFEATTYDWENMPMSLSSGNTAEEKNAVATLMLHCGIASEMSYSRDGSGTYVIEDYSQKGYDCAEYALKTYFGYNPAMKGKLRDYKVDEYGKELGRYPDEEWTAMVKEELLQGRPLLYSGYGDDFDGGHAFVCDGFDADNKFHFNWGWSGYYDGYFRLNSLTLSGVGTGGGSGNFNTLQHALFGVEPDVIDELTDGVYDVQMGTRLSLSESSVEFTKTANYKLAVSAMLKNYGELDYTGSLCLIIANENGTFADTVYLDTRTIESAHRYMLNESYTVNQLLMPGIYTFSLYYFDTDKFNYIPVGDKNYDAVATLDVYYTSDVLDVVSAIELDAEDDTIRVDTALQLTTRIQNLHSQPYKGKVRFLLVSLDMTAVAQVFPEVDLSVGVPTNDSIDIVCSDLITAPAGDYILALQYQSGTTWLLAGSRSHFNPVKVTVGEKKAVVNAVDNLSANVAIFPNPATEWLNITTLDACRMRMMTLTGQTVLSTSLTTGENRLSVSALPKGVYLLQLLGDKNTSTRRLIVE